jgi:transglutaminase-like putative cysteine protease
MSTQTESRTELEFGSENLFRTLALLGALTLTLSSVSVLYFISTVVGGTDQLLVLTVAALGAGTVFSWYVRPRTAAVIGLTLFATGFSAYILSVPQGFAILTEASGEVLGDVIALLTGLPIIRIKNPNVWILGYTPAPVFLSWYLALRERYVSSALVGGLALAVLVLTSDAGTKTTLAGTLGGIAAIGFGELDRRKGTIAQADVLAILFAVMMLLGLVVPLVPGGSASPIYVFGAGGGSGSPTLESSLTAAPEESQIRGAIQLSPEARFVVETEEKRYWRTAVYDRFTGGSWLRTGEPQGYDQATLRPPQGESERLRQRFTAQSTVSVLPSAYAPTELDGVDTDQVLVTDQGALLPKRSFALQEGDSFTVTSRVISPTAEELREAGTDYPDRIADTYLQTDVVSQRFADRTAQITQNARNPYETAKVIERYLEREKAYSLNVSRPNGNVAEKFLFEMDEGYCVYYASTMVMMLRSEGIPARYVTGYVGGQQIDDDQYLLRGLNSHAWVEAYFPGHGWVKFDPTPADDRVAAENRRVQQAREEGDDEVDIDDSEDDPLTTEEPTTTTPVETTTNGTTANGTANGTENGTLGAPIQNPGGGANVTATVAIPDLGEDGPGDANGSEGDSDGMPSLPSPEDLALGAVLLMGMAAGAHRSGVPDRLWNSLQMRYQGKRRSPDQDVERAYHRLEILLDRQYRPRRGEETPRDYVDALSLTGAGERVARVAKLYERAHYGDGVTEAEAEEAVDLVDALVAESTPVLGRLRR